MKYCMKVDTKGAVAVDADCLHAFGLDEKVSLGVLQACAASLHAKVVSVNEAAWILQGRQIVEMSPNFGYVSFNLDAPNHRSVEFGQSGGRHITDAYFNRPVHVDEVKNATVVEWKARYFIEPTNKRQEGWVTEMEDKRHLYRHKVPQVPVYRTYGPQDGEHFYFTELFERFPFTSMHEAFATTQNKTKTWCEAAWHHGLFKADADITTWIQTAFKFKWESKVQEKGLDFVAAEQPVASMLALRTRMLGEQALLDEDRDQLRSSPTDKLSDYFASCLEGRRYAPTPTADEVSRLCAQCATDPDQQAVLQVLDSPTPAQKLYRIQGPGGHGKSHVLRALIAKAVAQGKRVIVCATTAKAAQLLGPAAMTAHRAFGIQGGQWMPLSHPTMEFFIESADMIVLDEVSMASLGLLQELHARCIIAQPHKQDLPFAGKLVFLSGDIHQLPAVCSRCPAEDRCIHQPYRWPMWDKFQALDLGTNHRCRVQAWVDALNNIRTGQPTDDTLALLQGRVVAAGTDFPFADFPNAIILAGTNEEVDAYNEQRARELYPASALTTFEAKDTIPHEHRLSDKDKTYLKKKMRDLGVLPERLVLAVGMTVMVTRNQKHPAVANGETGEIVSMSDNAIQLRLPNPCGGQDATRLVTIQRVKETVYANRNKLERSMFPLSVGFARTVHKVQGDTLSCVVVVDFTNMARLGQAYVALSRVTDIANLYILPAGLQLTPQHFNPHVPQHLVGQEYGQAVDADAPIAPGDNEADIELP